MSNKPIKKVRAGNVQAAVWENEVEYKGEKKKTLSVTFQRSYKDAEGNWKNTDSFYMGDLPKIQACCQRLFMDETVKVEGEAEAEKAKN